MSAYFLGNFFECSYDRSFGERLEHDVPQNIDAATRMHRIAIVITDIHIRDAGAEVSPELC